MKDLKKWEGIIKNKNIHLPYQDYIRTILSWIPFVFHKNQWLISRFPDTNRINGIIRASEFDKNSEWLINRGINYDNESFFESFSRLFRSIDLPNMMHFYGYENSDYADIVAGWKNAYLSFCIVTDCENILYSCSVKDGSRNIIDSIMVWDSSENVYRSSGIIRSFNIFYSKCIENSSNIWFSSNLIGCTECILCNDLSNQSYCIKDKHYTKEEYFVKKQEVLKLKKLFSGFANHPFKAENIASEYCVWENIIESNTVTNGKFVYNVTNGNNLVLVGWKWDNMNEYSAMYAWSPYGSDFYGGVSLSGDHLYCSCHTALSSYIYYSYFMTSCSFCIGCVGLKNKSYCILNKQYTKEEWYVLADQIFTQMNQQGVLGDFFPWSLNPFYFNDTAASLVCGDFTKEVVVKEGYMWRDIPIKVDIPDTFSIIEISKIDQYQGYDTEEKWEIKEEILKKVIHDEQWNFYKIVPMELTFLRKYGLPLPTSHWLDRMKQVFRM